MKEDVFKLLLGLFVAFVFIYIISILLIDNIKDLREDQIDEVQCEVMRG